MRFGQYSGRLRRIERAAEQGGEAWMKSGWTPETGLPPISLLQMHGLKPIPPAQGVRLREWMLAHGWTEDENGDLALEHATEEAVG